jgi:hypothetical protein
MGSHRIGDGWNWLKISAPNSLLKTYQLTIHSPDLSRWTYHVSMLAFSTSIPLNPQPYLAVAHHKEQITVYYRYPPPSPPLLLGIQARGFPAL